MTDKQERQVLNEAVVCFGKDKQTDMMIEEMSELTKALLKVRRAGKRASDSLVDDVREEIADVGIMLDQMKIIYGDPHNERESKLERLAARLNMEIGKL